MATKPLLIVKDYAALEEPEGVRYGLSNGELIATPSSSHFHNRIRDDLSCLWAFVKEHKLGEVTSETDLKLAGEVVRRPDVAFIRAHRLEGVDLDQSPLPVAPDLAIEIVPKNDQADDLMVGEGVPIPSGRRAGRVADVPEYPARLSLRS